MNEILSKNTMKVSYDYFHKTSLKTLTDLSWKQVSVLGEVSLARNNPAVH